MTLRIAFSLLFFAFGSVSAARVLLTLFALDLGADAFAVGVLTATFYLCPLLLSWTVGRLADRFGARWLVLSGNIIGLTGLLVPFVFARIEALFVAALLTGLSFAFYLVTLQNLIGVSLVQLGTDLYQFYIPIYGHGIGLSASAIGAVLAAFATASFLVRFGLTRLISRFGEERVLSAAFALGAAGFVLVPLCDSALTLAAAAFVFGLGMACGQPITTMLMFSRSTEGRSGEMLGLRLTANNLMRVAGPALFGLVASALGLPAVFAINALMMVGGAFAARPHRTKRAG